MPKKSRKHKRGPGRRHSGPRRSADGRRGDAPDLLADVRRALAGNRPVELLNYASGLLSILDARPDPFETGGERPQIDKAEFLQSLFEVPTPETSALLAAVAGLGDDAVLRARVRREIAARPFDVPAWLLRLDGVAPYRIVDRTGLLGEGSTILIGARLAEGAEITAVLFVDHNLGSVVKDGFVVDVPVADLVARLASLGDDEEAGPFVDIDPATARARITDAVHHGAITYPPYETDTWPAVRPVVTWLCAALPAGGRGYERKEWSDKQRSKLLARFFASPHGRSIDDRLHRDLLDSILWYGTDYSTGDPMRWAVPKIEVLLLDWIPRKIIDDSRNLAKAPETLRAFIRFAHAEAQIPDSLTADALAAIDAFEPEYLEIISNPRPQGPLALMAAMGVPVSEDEWTGGSWEQLVRDDLAAAVGSEEALAALDDRPLPDEEFDWSGVPQDAAAPVEQILAVLDPVAAEPPLGPEYRTACRRFLHRVVAGDASVLQRRNARVEISAAAVCWIIAKANDALGEGTGQMFAKDLLARFGVTGSVSQRAHVFLAAAGCDRPSNMLTINLGFPELLVSTRRRALLELRDRYSAELG